MHNNHGNVVHHGVELLLLVSMLFLLAIPKSLLILKEFLYTSSFKNMRFIIQQNLSIPFTSVTSQLGYCRRVHWRGEMQTITV